jgi:hypothetical protein
VYTGLTTTKELVMDEINFELQAIAEEHNQERVDIAWEEMMYETYQLYAYDHTEWEH